MSLREIIADRKPRERVEAEAYTGWRYQRRYACPHGELATHLGGDLLPGAIMPGDSGATPEQARCVSVSTPEGGQGLVLVITATFLSIDCGDAALGSSTFRFTTTPVVRHLEHETVKTVYGVALTSTDTGIPARALTDQRDASHLTGTTPTLISDYVCRDASIIEEWRGRVLIRVEYAQFRAGRDLAAVVPISLFYFSRGGGSGGGLRRKYGELEYAIPHALLEDYRTIFEPGEATTLTGTFAFNDTTDILTCSAAVFSAEHVGRFVYPTGKSAKTILGYNGTTSVDVDSGGGDWSGVSNARLGVAVWPGDSGPWARRLTDFREIAECPRRPGFTYIKDIFSVPKPSYVVMEDPGQRAIIDLLCDPVQKKLDREPDRIVVGSFSQSTTTITCTSSVFAATDVGKVIAMTGKAPTLITAWISATQVTVASSATIAATANAVLFGRVIEGYPYAYDASGDHKGQPFFYKVVTGSNISIESKMQIRITTADTTLGLNTIDGLMGCTNDAILTNIGNAPIGTMLFFGVEARREYDINALWLIKYLFLRDPGGHRCGVDKHVAMAIQRKGWWVDPDDSDTFKESGKYERVIVSILRNDRVGQDPEMRNLGKKQASFSNLNGRAAWDQ